MKIVPRHAGKIYLLEPSDPLYAWRMVAALRRHFGKGFFAGGKRYKWARLREGRVEVCSGRVNYVPADGMAFVDAKGAAIGPETLEVPPAVAKRLLDIPCAA
jgi:hypothetical protein